MGEKTLRQRTYQIFHEPDASDPITLIDNYLVPVLIAIDVAALILGRVISYLVKILVY